MSRNHRGKLPEKPPEKSSRRKVWRITESAPMGEFVDPDQVVASAPVPLDEDDTKAPRGGWLESSLDLLNGSQVIENGEELSDDMFDELWGTGAAGTPPAPPKKD